MLFDRAQPFGGGDFMAIEFVDIEAVDGGAFFRGDFGRRNVQA